MLRRRIIKFSISVLVVFVAIGLFLNYMKSNIEYYHLFEDQRELFEAVKDEIEHIEKSKLGNQSNAGDVFIYLNRGNAAQDEFHAEVSVWLQGYIQQINELLDDKLSQLRYAESNGKRVISFVFDWEHQYGDTYHIVYCESRGEVEISFDEVNIMYDLKELDDDWYGTRIK